MGRCQIFTEQEKESVRHGGKVLRGCLEYMQEQVRPGVTTLQLDRLAEEYIRSHEGCTPAFKGYHGFPGTLCTSVNEQCVHAIPTDYELQEGDIIATDCGVLYDDLYTDACITIPVGQISEELETFLKVSKDALYMAVDMIKAGLRVGDLSHAIQTFVEERGYKCVRSLTGHGLGKTLHQYPDIPNVGQAGTGGVLPAGTLIAIEPITSMGSDSVVESGDGWTLSTRDGAFSAHYEHSLFVEEGGCEIIA